MENGFFEHSILCEYSAPDGLRKLCKNIAAQVLNAQPKDVYSFIAGYLNQQLRERDQKYKEEAMKIACAMANDDLSTDIPVNLALRGVSVAMAAKACTQIQAVYRGYRTRKLIRERHEDNKAAKPEADVELIKKESVTVVEEPGEVNESDDDELVTESDVEELDDVTFPHDDNDVLFKRELESVEEEPDDLNESDDDELNPVQNHKFSEIVNTFLDNESFMLRALNNQITTLSQERSQKVRIEELSEVNEDNEDVAILINIDDDEVEAIPVEKTVDEEQAGSMVDEVLATVFQLVVDKVAQTMAQTMLFNNDKIEDSCQKKVEILSETEQEGMQTMRDLQVFMGMVSEYTSEMGVVELEEIDASLEDHDSSEEVNESMEYEDPNSMPDPEVESIGYVDFNYEDETSDEDYEFDFNEDIDIMLEPVQEESETEMSFAEERNEELTMVSVMQRMDALLKDIEKLAAMSSSHRFIEEDVVVQPNVDTPRTSIDTGINEENLNNTFVQTDSTLMSQKIETMILRMKELTAMTEVKQEEDSLLVQETVEEEEEHEVVEREEHAVEEVEEHVVENKEEQVVETVIADSKVEEVVDEPQEDTSTVKVKTGEKHDTQEASKEIGDNVEQQHPGTEEDALTALIFHELVKTELVKTNGQNKDNAVDVHRAKNIIVSALDILSNNRLFCTNTSREFILANEKKLLKKSRASKSENTI